MNYDKDETIKAMLSKPEETKELFNEFKMNHKMICQYVKDIQQVGTLEFILSVNENEFVSFLKKNIKKDTESNIEDSRKTLNSGMAREIVYLSIAHGILDN